MDSKAEDAFANMVGEADIAGAGDGYIYIDRSVPDHPVIRFRADRLAEAGKGGAAGPLAAGDDTNIVFTPCTDASDARHGKTLVDVYYS